MTASLVAFLEFLSPPDQLLVKLIFGFEAGGVELGSFEVVYAQASPPRALVPPHLDRSVGDFPDLIRFERFLVGRVDVMRDVGRLYTAAIGIAERSQQLFDFRAQKND